MLDIFADLKTIPAPRRRKPGRPPADSSPMHAEKCYLCARAWIVKRSKLTKIAEFFDASERSVRSWIADFLDSDDPRAPELRRMKDEAGRLRAFSAN